uniref:Uncharacterized protein n=1 Tax=Arundo donax TaxID=35708 RepID=A0A0A9ES05_ARUDO
MPGNDMPSSSSGMTTGHFSPPSRNICSVSMSRPRARIWSLMPCAVAPSAATMDSSTPLR